MHRLKMIALILLLYLPAVCNSQSVSTGDSALAAYRFRRAGELYEASRYDSVAAYYLAALNYYRQQGQQEMELKCLAGLAEAYRIGNDFSRSENYLEQAEKLMRNIPGLKNESRAELLFVRGKLTFSRGDYLTALSVLEHSVELMDSLEVETLRLARAVNFLGNAYLASGDPNLAELNYRRFGEIILSLPGRPLIEEAWYHNNMAIISSRKGNYANAIEHNSQSCIIQKAVYGDRYPELGDAYYNIASGYSITGAYDSAGAYLDTAELYYSTYFPGDLIRTAHLYIMRGNIEYRKGSYLNARHHFERSWNLLSGQLSPSHYLMTSLYINLGNISYILQDYDQALRYYSMLADQSGSLHPSGMLSAYHYLAITQARLGNDVLAEQYFRRLISERTRYYGEHNLVLAEDYFSFAEFLASTGRIEPGLGYCRKALAIRNNILGSASHYTADCYRLLGDCWNSTESADSALYYYQEALHSLSGSYDPADIYNNPAPGEAGNQLVYGITLKGKAGALQRLGEKNDTLRKDYQVAALSCYKLIFPVMDGLRNSSMSEEGRLFVADNERQTYNRAVMLALSLYEGTGDKRYLDKSFLIAEKAKYNTLLMAVRNNNAISFSRVPADLVAELQDIKTRISSYRDLIREEELTGNPGKEKLRLWHEELYNLQEREQRFVRDLESDYPEYYRLKYNTSVSTPEEIMAQLQRKDRLIEYYLSTDALVAFVLSGKEMTVKVHPIDSSFRMRLDTLRGFCFNNTLINNRLGVADHFRRVSSELYDVLIRPCGVHDGERLIIIPDAAMNYLPFDALLSDSIVSSIYYKDHPFLIRSNPIIYSYSATLYINTSPGKNRKGGELLAMAPAYDAGSGSMAAATRALDISRKELGPLQGTREEVAGIQKITGGMAISGYEASEYRFKQLAPGYRILHMAMHAYVDDTDPLYSRLVFADNREGGEDGFLNAYEIYNLDLSARMVVLSACQTGAGIVRMGEGIMSLARAFYYSGVPNVVMTLWAVSDTSGRKLMVSFYDRLSHGLDKGRAMQKAKIRYMDSVEPLRQQPYYWAGYIVTGDPSPVFRPGIKWFIIAAVILLPCLAVTIYIRHRRKKVRAGS